jgi:hypothetical protein
VVLGRTVVLSASSECLNTGICSFHLVSARKNRVVGWCKGEPLFVVMQVGACVTEVGASIQLVLEHSGSWCFLLVGARKTREFMLSTSCILLKKRL